MSFVYLGIIKKHMTLLYIAIYVIGFIATAWIHGPKDAHGDDDVMGQVGVSLLWPFIIVAFVAIIPVFIVQAINELRK
jgi:heme/copper-type cytochrome/quinol oxidase subunit 2